MATEQTIRELMSEGLASERNGDWKAATRSYLLITGEHPGNRDAVKRLLVAYRHLKDPKAELTTIRMALKAIGEKNQATQTKWLAANPDAAKVSKAVLRSLGGNAMTAFGTDPFVQQLLKRKEQTERKLGGKTVLKAKPKRKSDEGNTDQSGEKSKSSEKKNTALIRVMPTRSIAGHFPVNAGRKPKVKRLDQKAAVESKKEAVARRKADLAARKAVRNQEIADRKEQAREKREALELAKAERKREALERKAAAKKRAADKQIKNAASFFVIELHYKAAKDKIDEELAEHQAFLQKLTERKIVLIAGRQADGKGEQIIAKAKSQAALRRILKEDVLIAKKLVTSGFVEFKGQFHPSF